MVGRVRVVQQEATDNLDAVVQEAVDIGIHQREESGQRSGRIMWTDICSTRKLSLPRHERGTPSSSEGARTCSRSSGRRCSPSRGTHWTTRTLHS